MRKLLKLFAIGALFAVVPIPAFADTFDLRFDFFDAADRDRPDGLSCGGNITCRAESLFNTSLVDVTSFLGLSGSNVTVGFRNFTTGTIGTDPVFDLSDRVAYKVGSDPAVIFNFVEGDGVHSVDKLFSSGSAVNIPHPLFSLTNIGGSLTPGNYFLVIGEGENEISDVLRAHITAIPEPEIYAMMAIGLAMMGFVARRRRGLAAAA